MLGRQMMMRPLQAALVKPTFSRMLMNPQLPKLAGTVRLFGSDHGHAAKSHVHHAPSHHKDDHQKDAHHGAAGHHDDHHEFHWHEGDIVPPRKWDDHGPFKYPFGDARNFPTPDAKQNRLAQFVGAVAIFWFWYRLVDKWDYIAGDWPFLKKGH